MEHYGGTGIYALSINTYQEGLPIEISEAIVGTLKWELAATAVNAPMVPAEVSFNLHLYSLYSLYSCLYQHVTSRHIKYN